MSNILLFISGRHWSETYIVIAAQDNTDTCMHIALFWPNHRLALLFRSDAKAEDDADTHSQSGAATRRHRRSATPEKPELRHTRSKDGKPKQSSEQRRPGGSLPAKLEQKGSGEKLALNQGSSGSPGKGSSSGGLQRLGNGKTAVEVSHHVCDK